MALLAQALARQGRADESSALLDALIDRFAEDHDEQVLGEVRDARSLRSRERMRAHARRWELVGVTAVVYVPGVAVLVTAAPGGAARVSAWAGAVALLASETRALWRVKRIRGRRGLATALRHEYPAAKIALGAGGAAIVALQFMR